MIFEEFFCQDFKRSLNINKQTLADFLKNLTELQDLKTTMINAKKKKKNKLKVKLHVAERRMSEMEYK